ncbi:MAG: hypothetical protein M1832_005160 [Thelocarpon impressellum]|nr:MAG: hypothetical protein M1832_005160 [Thelocarpon impressellum]
MVSQPDPPDRALALRKAPSFSSRTSTRRSRHNRSHHGGSTVRPQNEFPVFTHTGDVDILIRAGGKEKRYLLHRLILAQCSGFFEAGTSEQWSRVQASATAATPEQTRELSRIGEDEAVGSEVGSEVGKANVARMRWRYELEGGEREGGSGDDVPMLVQKGQVSTIFGGDGAHSRPPPSASRMKAIAPQAQPGFFKSMANLSAVHIPRSQQAEDPANDTLRDYDNLFRIFYNHAPALDAVNIANAYIECKTLLQLADMYNALGVVGPRVDHHLLQFQSRLWKQIAKYPPSYLRLGYLARSKVIFAEAIVHVVGQWPASSSHLRSTLPEPVLDLIEDKADELAELRAAVDAKLFRLTLTTARGDPVTPANAYLDWTAVSLFRQWLAENTSAPSPPAVAPTNTKAPHPSPTMSAGRAYRLLGAGVPSSYLGHDELKRFLKLHPAGEYSRDTARRFERRVDELKALARDAAAPLLRSFLELDLGRDAAAAAGLGYLTCTRVGERDFPWEDE